MFIESLPREPLVLCRQPVFSCSKIFEREAAIFCRYRRLCGAILRKPNGNLRVRQWLPAQCIHNGSTNPEILSCWRLSGISPIYHIFFTLIVPIFVRKCNIARGPTPAYVFPNWLLTVPTLVLASSMNGVPAGGLVSRAWLPDQE